MKLTNIILLELFSHTQKGVKRPFVAFHGRQNKRFKANLENDKKKEFNSKTSRFSRKKNASSKLKDKTKSHTRDFRPIGGAKHNK